jgi:hypothetical protein
MSKADVELADRIVEFLNQLLQYDRAAIASLVANRVPCNKALANHPTVQAGFHNGAFNVGLLGLLNGLCGTRENETGLINAIYDGDARELQDLVKFAVHSD